MGVIFIESNQSVDGARGTEEGGYFPFLVLERAMRNDLSVVESDVKIQSAIVRIVKISTANKMERIGSAESEKLLMLIGVSWAPTTTSTG